MTTPDPTEKRSVTLQLRLTPTEAAPWKAQVDKDHNLSDLVRGVLNDAAADFPRTRRAQFEAQLAAGDFIEIGRFRNEFGEEYVLYRYDRGPVKLGDMTIPAYVYITGDELGWRQGATYENGKLGEMFMLSRDERKEIDKILGAASDPTRQGVEAGEKIKRETLAETGEFKSTTKLGRAAQGVTYWRGGCAAAEAGYPYGSEDHQAFFMGFMEGITGR
jgi:hypothetical protein